MESGRAGAVWGRCSAGACSNLLEALIDHQLLQLHHVMDAAVDHVRADLAFLASGLVMIVAGLALARTVAGPPSG
jgi:uncharacterized membrane protein